MYNCVKLSPYKPYSWGFLQSSSGKLRRDHYVTSSSSHQSKAYPRDICCARTSNAPRTPFERACAAPHAPRCCTVPIGSARCRSARSSSSTWARPTGAAQRAQRGSSSGIYVSQAQQQLSCAIASAAGVWTLLTTQDSSVGLVVKPQAGWRWRYSRGTRTFGSLTWCCAQRSWAACSRCASWGSLA